VVRFLSHYFFVNVNVDYAQFTDYNGCLCPKDDMPLLAERYKYVDTVGHGQSAVVIKAQVCATINSSTTFMCN